MEPAFQKPLPGHPLPYEEQDLRAGLTVIVTLPSDAKPQNPVRTKMAPINNLQPTAAMRADYPALAAWNGKLFERIGSFSRAHLVNNFTPAQLRHTQMCSLMCWLGWWRAHQNDEDYYVVITQVEQSPEYGSFLFKTSKEVFHKIATQYDEVYQTLGWGYAPKGASFRERANAVQQTSFRFSERDAPQHAFGTDGRLRVEWVEPDVIASIVKAVIEPPSPL